MICTVLYTAKLQLSPKDPLFHQIGKKTTKLSKKITLNKVKIKKTFPFCFTDDLGLLFTE